MSSLFNWIVYLQCFVNYCCKVVQLCTFIHSLFIFFFIIVYHRILNIVLMLWSSLVQLLGCVRLLATPWTAARPGLPVRHQLPEFTQTHVHWVSDASNHLILCHPLLLLPSILPSIRVFSNESGGQSIEDSASTSVLPMNIQDWSPLGWTGWIS